MATLLVPVTTDFSAQALNDIDTIQFTNGAAATATFAASQFDDVKIKDNVLIQGNGQINRIVVNGGSVNASAWTFASWSANDTITLNGAAASINIIIGSSQKDAINGGTQVDILAGGDGADTIAGGDGDDSIVYSNTSHLVAGETVNGGAGTNDQIAINTGGAFDFSTATLSNVERVDYSGVANTLTFAGTQLGGAGDVTAIDGSAAINTLNVSGSAISLSAVTFSTWTNGTDIINLTGTAGNDTITGSAQADIITGGAGRDTLAGGNGDDDFVYNATGDVEANENIAGGNGTNDRILITVGGNFDFSTALIGAVERFVFGVNDATVTFDDGQFGGAQDITAMEGSGAVNTVVVNGSAINMAGVAFNNWSNGSDPIQLNGTAGADTITGSNFNDTIAGGAGADTMSGGGNSDTFVYGAAADLVAGESVDGGAGVGPIDTVLLNGAGAYDFSNKTLVNVERVAFSGAVSTITLDDGQIGAAGNSDVEAIEGSGAVNALVVTGANINLQFVTFNNWTEGTDTVTLNGDATIASDIFGSSVADIVNGGTGNDDINGRAGADVIHAGDGNDQIFFSLASDLVAGEVIDGGNDANFGANDLIQVSGVAGDVFDFSVTTISDVEVFVFGTASVTAVFSGTQIGDPAGIAGVGGTVGVDTVNVLGGAIDVSTVNFNIWEAQDIINLIGTAGADTIVGSNLRSNTFNAGGGADSLTGGTVDDTFVYGAGSDLVAGEILAGGLGTDKILLSPGAFDFTVATVSGIDKLEFGSAGAAQAVVSNTSIGVGNIGEIIGGTGVTNVLTISGGSVDVSWLIFSGGWTFGGAGADQLILEGAGTPDTLIGTTQGETINGNGGNDAIDGKGGTDVLAGGLGNDTYMIDFTGSTIVELAGGGTGSDTVNTTLATFTLAANVERVNFNTNANAVGTGNAGNNRFQSLGGDDRFVDVLGGADIFSGGAGTDTVDFRSSATGAILNFITEVHGGAAAGDSYSGIEKFLGSNTAGDTMTAGGVGRVIYAGFGGADTLSGGIKNDQLLGGAGGDTLSGGADRDSLDGGTGNDTMTGGSEGDVFVFIDAAFGQDTITDYQDGLDSLKILSTVANDIGDFTIAGNGTNSVLLTLNADPANTITLNGASAITITNADIVFF